MRVPKTTPRRSLPVYLTAVLVVGVAAVLLGNLVVKLLPAGGRVRADRNNANSTTRKAAASPPPTSTIEGGGGDADWRTLLGRGELPADVELFERALGATFQPVSDASALRTQLITAGDAYSTQNFVEFARALDGSRRIFGAGSKGSGRLFLQHHVGAASIALYLRLPMFLITAALLHSAYGYGVLDKRSVVDVSNDATAACALRRTLAAEYGDAIEALVYCDQYFPTSNFDDEGIALLYAGWRLGRLQTALQRACAVLVLLNEVDEFVYSDQLVKSNRMRSITACTMVCEMLESLTGSTALAVHAAWQYTLARSVLNWTAPVLGGNALSSTKKKKHSALRFDLPPQLADRLAALRTPQYNRASRPPHGTLMWFVPPPLRVRNWSLSDKLAAWDEWYGAYERVCCDHGGPCGGFNDVVF
jgi:hypothetical protein